MHSAFHADQKYIYFLLHECFSCCFEVLKFYRSLKFLTGVAWKNQEKNQFKGHPIPKKYNPFLTE